MMYLTKGTLALSLCLSFIVFYYAFKNLSIGSSFNFDTLNILDNSKVCYMGEWLLINNSTVQAKVEALRNLKRFDCTFTEIYRNFKDNTVYLSAETHRLVFNGPEKKFHMRNNFYDVRCWNKYSDYHTTIAKLGKGSTMTPTKSQSTKIEEDGCKFPFIDFFHPSLYRRYKDLGNYKCKGLHMTYLVDGILRYNETDINTFVNKKIAIDFNCSVSQIVRKAESYNDYIFYRNLTDSLKIPFEFIRVKCFNKSGSVFHTDYHAQIIKKNKGIKVIPKDEKNSKDKLNVLIVGMDSTSRGNFVRHMPKLRSFLKDEMKAVEMKRFNKVQKNTVVNIMPLMTGSYLREIERKFVNESSPFSRRFYDDEIDNFIWKEYSKLGYFTLMAEDAYYMATFNYLTRGFRNPPTDYYYRPLAIASEKANYDLCAGNKLKSKRIVDYTNEFINKFKDEKYFAFVFGTQVTHDNNNGLSRVKDLYWDFITNNYYKGVLNNTLLIVMGDHGPRWGYVRSSQFGWFEDMMPAICSLTYYTFEETKPIESLIQAIEL
ncbi:DgyrCDS11 [Dimorphilus gyrociliatus]|uniref:DgyrCDS11 n=1 Tax=Dimorphilus gyrociliatus TaxID=2664684 RepID=A0A7I8V4W5_9ANNE|nr:DgyrCDS11 [Dimorphilus gyrociliatus]